MFNILKNYKYIIGVTIDYKKFVKVASEGKIAALYTLTYSINQLEENRHVKYLGFRVVHKEICHSKTWSLAMKKFKKKLKNYKKFFLHPYTKALIVNYYTDPFTGYLGSNIVVYMKMTNEYKTGINVFVYYSTKGEIKI